MHLLIRRFEAAGVALAASRGQKLSGTNSELGRDLLNQSGLQLTAVSDMDEGARVAISSLEGSE